VSWELKFLDLYGGEPLVVVENHGFVGVVAGSP
jgi:hypothetical protein